MLSDFKSATLWAVILWALIFVAFSAIMFSPALKDMVQAQKAIELVALPVLVFGSAYMYLKGIKKPALNEGLALGVYFLVIGVILDNLITIPMFVKSFKAFYSEWSIWAGFLETVVFSAAAGYYLEKKK